MSTLADTPVNHYMFPAGVYPAKVKETKPDA